ncbi:hypothetical protein J6590_103201, partial [Homalodisca vitripennis]
MSTEGMEKSNDKYGRKRVAEDVCTRKGYAIDTSDTHGSVSDLVSVRVSRRPRLGLIGGGNGRGTECQRCVINRKSGALITTEQSNIASVKVKYKSLITKFTRVVMKKWWSPLAPNPPGPNSEIVRQDRKRYFLTESKYLEAESALVRQRRKHPILSTPSREEGTVMKGYKVAMAARLLLLSTLQSPGSTLLHPLKDTTPLHFLLFLYRSENRPIIYMDDTYIHTTHATPKTWTYDSNEGCKVPVSEGKRLIIVHDGNEKGFIKNP